MEPEKPKIEKEISKEEALRRLDGCLGSLTFMINIQQNSVGERVGEEQTKKLNDVIAQAQGYLAILEK